MVAMSLMIIGIILIHEISQYSIIGGTMLMLLELLILGSVFIAMSDERELRT